MGKDRGPGPDDVVIDGIWIGEPEGGGADQVAGGCALSILIALSVPPITWWALARAAGPADPEAPASAGVAWGMGFLWAVVVAWAVLGLVVSSAYTLGRSMVAAMLGFEAAFAVLMLAIAFLS